MITNSDLITIPYSEDMTQVGIKYVCQSLPYKDHPRGGKDYNQLRYIVAVKAVELAFKRHLNNLRIPHHMMASTPFTDPENYAIAIGGRRCFIQCFLETKKKQIRAVHKEPQQLLQTQAMVPVDQVNKDYFTDDDIYIFAFLTALITPNQGSLQKAILARQPIYMLHILPQKWILAGFRGSLGELAVKSNMVSALNLELGGYDENHSFQSEVLMMNPRIRTSVKKNFSALSYFYSTQLPNETIAVYSSTLKETYLVKPMDWRNIGVYGFKIFFGGYITCGEFQKSAIRLPKVRRDFQYLHSRTEGFTIPFKELHPLENLFERAKDWSQDQIS